MPKIEDVEVSTLIGDAIAAGYNKSWDSVDGYWKWVFELYGWQVVKDFGRVLLGEKGVLPLSVVDSWVKQRGEDGKIAIGKGSLQRLGMNLWNGEKSASMWGLT